MNRPDSIRWAGEVRRHGALRWGGIGLFGLALGVTAWHCWLVATAGMPWTKVIPCLLGLGLSLGAFGANDDTALAAMASLESVPGAPAYPDLVEERRRRPGRMAHVHSSPRTGMILPLVAGVIVALLAARAAHWAPPAGDQVEALP